MKLQTPSEMTNLPKTLPKSSCIFIISHGRPDKVITLKALRRSGYTGPLFIVCDNEDKTLEQYRAQFGASKVLVFDKLSYAGMIDNGDNFQNRRTTTHARNACFDFAEKLGFEYFLVLDDDYTEFKHNYNKRGAFKRSVIRRINLVFSAMFEFLESDERLMSVCFLQGGDLVGGESALKKGVFPFRKRKAMNSFFCKTSRRFWFFTRLNEDVNTYLSLGNRGGLFLSIPEIALNQMQTQATTGGMSEAYLASGTYVKSFYTVMIGPSYASVQWPRANVTKQIRRIHHKIAWNNAVPKIIDEAYRKQ
jgi:hypothetical protein